MKKNIKISVFFLPLLFIAAFGHARETLISGQTMGTTYHIKLVTGDLPKISVLKEQIDQRLEQINQSMSTYRKDSEISQFNSLKIVGQRFEISQDFARVFKEAKKLYKITGGAWDGSMHPLINLWGFGKSGRKTRPPEKKKIASLLMNVGFDSIDLVDGRYLLKKKASVSIDLASVAKGYAVDQVAGLIRKNNIKNFLVEVGGEVYASGVRKDGHFWRVGINRPRKEASHDEIYKIVTLKDKAFATSGDYRNFFEVKGKRYSHILDPKTGYPVANSVVSVSIVAETCAFADGLATAVMVMGRKKGLKLINALPGIEGMIVVRQADSQLMDYPSIGFVVKAEP